MTDLNTVLANATVGLAAATVGLALGTGFLAGFTWIGLRQQRAQFTDAEQNAVLPFPVVEGVIFFPKAELGEGIQLSFLKDMNRDLSVRVTNLGRGPALYLQWNLTSLPANGMKRYERVRRHELPPFHLPQQATHELLLGPRPAHESAKMTAGDGGQVTIWYRDTFGNEYECGYEHHGLVWRELARGKAIRETSRRRWWRWRRP